ncbi:hypothetical protein CPB83DRAFT_133191 [Crepidotus variabilis]|uniref:Uncharacterized protein n=1 Tax=Crepidotus variabilis TaxID=179855 RepID=A0A9P6EK84_9AGAR|nr:hypothetical protein CPB83DRAFT_133191 [Crepidotus variabilis]
MDLRFSLEESCNTPNHLEIDSQCVNPMLFFSVFFLAYIGWPGVGFLILRDLVSLYYSRTTSWSMNLICWKGVRELVELNGATRNYREPSRGCRAYRAYRATAHHGISK